MKTFRLLCKAELEHYELIERLEPFSSENFEELYGFFEDYGGHCAEKCAISSNPVRYGGTHVSCMRCLQLLYQRIGCEKPLSVV